MQSVEFRGISDVAIAAVFLNHHGANLPSLDGFHPADASAITTE